jgi:hypothetical protein
MTRAPLHKIAAGLMGFGFGVNLLAATLGLRTICTAGRDRARVDTKAGYAASVGVSCGLLVLWLLHFLDPKKIREIVR